MGSPTDHRIEQFLLSGVPVGVVPPAVRLALLKEASETFLATDKDEILPGFISVGQEYLKLFREGFDPAKTSWLEGITTRFKWIKLATIRHDERPGKSGWGRYSTTLMLADDGRFMRHSLSSHYLDDDLRWVLDSGEIALLSDRQLKSWLSKHPDVLERALKALETAWQKSATLSLRRAQKAMERSSELHALTAKILIS